MVGAAIKVLDQNTLFEKKNYKISLKIKLMPKVVRNAAVHDNGNCTCIIPPSPPQESLIIIWVLFFFPIFSSLLFKTTLTKFDAPNLDSSSKSLPITLCFFTQVSSHLPPQQSFISFYFNIFVFPNCCESGVICYDSRVASLIL